MDDIWDVYALHSKKDGLIRRHEFERFVKNTFKMATFQYKYDQKLFNEMYMTKIKLTDGKIAKPDMEEFLRSLQFVIPPNIQLITEQTNEENDADVQSFEQKLNKSD